MGMGMLGWGVGFAFDMVSGEWCECWCGGPGGWVGVFGREGVEFDVDVDIDMDVWSNDVQMYRFGGFW